MISAEGAGTFDLQASVSRPRSGRGLNFFAIGGVKTLEFGNLYGMVAQLAHGRGNKANEQVIRTMGHMRACNTCPFAAKRRDAKPSQLNGYHHLRVQQRERDPQPVLTNNQQR